MCFSTQCSHITKSLKRAVFSQIHALDQIWTCSHFPLPSGEQMYRSYPKGNKSQTCSYCGSLIFFCSAAGIKLFPWEMKCFENSKWVLCSVIRRLQECLRIQVLCYNKPNQLHIAILWREKVARVCFSENQKISPCSNITRSLTHILFSQIHEAVLIYSIPMQHWYIVASWQNNHHCQLNWCGGFFSSLLHIVHMHKTVQDAFKQGILPDIPASKVFDLQVFCWSWLVASS